VSNKTSNSKLKLIIGAVAVAAAAFIGFRYWQAQQSALPEGIVSGNGRIEGKLVDIAAKEPLRVKEILVDEGAIVRPGQVLVRLDTVTLEADLAEARANVAQAQESLAVTAASMAKSKSEIDLAVVEVDRSSKLAQEGAGSQRDLDVRKTKLGTTKATMDEAKAMLETSKQRVEVAKAKVASIQTRIDDATLKAPVTGRVLYRLAEPGEVLAPGGKALTLVNLEDIYMEIFLPSEYAANLKVGSDARITVDHDPVRSIAAKVSFVSPEAQFTPKQVETKSERDKLMFRVKIQVPPELASQFIERIKTGIRGVGYVKINESAVWPPRLTNLLQASALPPAPPAPTPPAMPAATLPATSATPPAAPSAKPAAATPQAK
jgi:HlyD family secretion protein